VAREHGGLVSHAIALVNIDWGFVYQPGS
jgi:hypothetical protein